MWFLGKMRVVPFGIGIFSYIFVGYKLLSESDPMQIRFSIFYQVLPTSLFLFLFTWMSMNPLMLQGQDTTQQDTSIDSVTTPASPSPQLAIKSEKTLVRKGHTVTFYIEAVDQPNINTEVNILANGILIPVRLENGKGEIVLTGDSIKESNSFVIPDQEIVQVSLIIVNFPLWMSLIPPLLAILLALVFKEVVISLFSGIVLGSIILGFYDSGSLMSIFQGFLTALDTYVLSALADPDHQSIIVFSMLIGGMVAIISRNGGMLGIVTRISRIAKTAKSGQFATWLLGVVIFFDDYANSLVVGNTMRPITDRLKISREKLSYIVDSTAAPVAALAFISTWIAAELGYIEDGMAHLAGFPEDLSPYKIFLQSIGYSFYPILTLVFILLLIASGKDFGPMLKAEQRARSTGAVANSTDSESKNAEMSHFDPKEGIVPKAFNAVIPIVVLVVGVLIGLIYTGYDSEIWTAAENFPSKLSKTIGNADSYKALMWASLTAVVVSIIMTMGQRLMNLGETMETMVSGFKVMMSALIILTLAWGLQGVTADIHTADLLTDLVGTNIAPYWLPLITFVLGALVSFATGSSWGTMAILYPLMIPLTWNIGLGYGLETPEALSIFFNVVASVLAGSVLGDHCSPISDTTILSSLACDCNHIDHVRTQLPYALVVGLVAVGVGTVPSSLGMPTWLGLILGIAALYGIIRFWGKYTTEGVEEKAKGA